MGSSEEYLDELLKAAIDNDTDLGDGAEKEEQKNSGFEEAQEKEGWLEELDLESLLNETEALIAENTKEEQGTGASDMVEKTGEEQNEDALHMAEKMEEKQNEDTLHRVEKSEEEQNVDVLSMLSESTSENAAHGEKSHEDEELAEISELLSRSGDGAAIDDDMLALLESLPEESGSEYAEQLGVEEAEKHDIFSMDEPLEEALVSDVENQETEQAVDEEEIEALLKEKDATDKEKKRWFGKGKQKKEKTKEKRRKKAEGNAKENEADSDAKEEGIATESDFLTGDILGEGGFGGMEELEALMNSETLSRQPEQSDEESPKKAGRFQRFIDFLMEEEPEEEAPKKKKKEKKEKKEKGKKAAKAVQTQASDENEAILEELETEDKKNGKKKGKTRKNKERKKEKRKEKKKEQITEETGRRLPRKIVIGIFAACFSVMVLLIVVDLLLPKTIAVKEARKAYYNHDYKTAYENLAGRDLNSSDSLIRDKATTLMLLQRQYESFVNYYKMGNDLEALNALLKGCDVYMELKDKAAGQNVLTELDDIHSYILDSLEYIYGISEEEATMLYRIENDEEYTMRLQEIAEKGKAETDGAIPTYQPGE